MKKNIKEKVTKKPTKRIRTKLEDEKVIEVPEWQWNAMVQELIDLRDMTYKFFKENEKLKDSSLPLPIRFTCTCGLQTVVQQ